MKLIIPQKVSETIDNLHGEREFPTSPVKHKQETCKNNFIVDYLAATQLFSPLCFSLFLHAHFRRII